MECNVNVEFKVTLHEQVSSNNMTVLAQKPEVLSQRRLGGKFKN